MSVSRVAGLMQKDSSEAQERADRGRQTKAGGLGAEVSDAAALRSKLASATL
jgi:hypothetical protein